MIRTLEGAMVRLPGFLGAFAAALLGCDAVDSGDTAGDDAADSAIPSSSGSACGRWANLAEGRRWDGGRRRWGRGPLELTKYVE